MRSGWPHTQEDHGTLPAGQQQAFGPEISWPTGHSGLEYGDGGYRYPAPVGSQPYTAQQSYTAQPPAAPSAPAGEHPYATFGPPGYGAGSGDYAQQNVDAFGYGDPGYSNPAYDGPAAQDAGIAGTRTVSGFVESSHAGTGYAQSAQNPSYALPPGHPSAAYPVLGAPVDEAQGYPQPYQATEMYREPWDYDQPLRYDGEPSAAPPDGYGATNYTSPNYDPADYNGSEYSMPGVNGQGYDLSGIIGTGEFPAIGYDQPSYDRLAYDDPRYEDAARYDAPRYGTPRYNETRFDMPALEGGYDETRFDEPPHTETRFDMPALGADRRNETRFDMPALDDFDENRLDHVWPAVEDLPADDAGYGDDGFGGGANDRSGYQESDQRGLVGFSRRLSETRFDMPALGEFEGGTRFDETRIDGMGALAPATEFRPAGSGLLAPSDEAPLSWADETSLDTFGDLDAPAGLPAAFTPRAPEGAMADTDTAARRAIGKRRGRSSDKRQWVALGVIAVVTAGAIAGAVMKFAHSGPGGPAHSVSVPNKAGSFTREPNLEQQMKVGQLASDVVAKTHGQASDVKPAVYQHGSSAPGSNPQIFMFVGGKLANGAPAASIANFEQQYRSGGAREVPAGALGGEAACANATANGQSVAMCVWFDNDTFGELVSPTMSTTTLATTMTSVRPSLEHVAQ